MREMAHGVLALGRGYIILDMHISLTCVCPTDTEQLFSSPIRLESRRKQKSCPVMA